MLTLRVISSWLFFFFLTSGAGMIVAQTRPETKWPGAVPPVPILITGTVDETELVTLHGNTRPEANATNDQGRLADNFPLEHMILLLRRSRVQEQALTGLIDRLHDPMSPYFHHWLTAQQLGERYGLAHNDIHTITRWLRLHGFSVNTVYPNQFVIDFSGTAGQVRQAFHTEIHRLKVGDKEHIANMTDPQIPAALAPAVVGVVSLSDFMPQPMHEPRNQSDLWRQTTTLRQPIWPRSTILIRSFEAAVSGQGQTIALVEDSDVYNPADWSTFRSVLGLSGYSGGSFTEIHPAPPYGANNCTDPGPTGDDGEAILDAEWSSAAAPNAAILMISCANTASSFGGFIALQNLLNDGTAPAIISISYGGPETEFGRSR